MMNYLVILEGELGNYSAYVPDLPGCISVGENVDEVRANIGEAIALYLEETKQRGQHLPLPSSQAIMVSAA